MKWAINFFALFVLAALFGAVATATPYADLYSTGLADDGFTPLAPGSIDPSCPRWADWR